MDGGTPIEANRTLAAVRKLFNWALSRDIIAVSPCAGVKPPSAETARDRVLTDDELRLVWQAAEQMGYPFGPLVQMLVLTGQRRDEVRKMTWDEIDLERRLWKLAAGRTKNNKSHDIPLSAPVVGVLESLPRIVGSRLVFTLDGVRPASSLSYHKSRLNSLSGVASWTLHDLRRTCASGLARLGVNLPVIEKILNHTSGSFRGVVAIYQRHDFGAEKAKALELWGQHVDELVSSQSDVCPCGGRRPVFPKFRLVAQRERLIKTPDDIVSQEAEPCASYAKRAPRYLHSRRLSWSELTTSTGQFTDQAR